MIATQSIINSSDEIISLFDDNSIKILSINEAYFNEMFSINNTKAMKLYTKKIANFLKIDIQNICSLDLTDELQNYYTDNCYHCIFERFHINKNILIKNDTSPFLCLFDKNHNVAAIISLTAQSLYNECLPKIIKQINKNDQSLLFIKSFIYHLNSENIFFSYKEYKRFLDNDPDSYQFFTIKKENDGFSFNVINYIQFILHNLGINHVIKLPIKQPFAMKYYFLLISRC